MRLYCGLGFNCSTGAGHRALFAKEADPAVLLWDYPTSRRLGNAKLGGDTDLTKNQLNMFGYLFELCYDLLRYHQVPMFPGAPASMSLGFVSLNMLLPMNFKYYVNVILFISCNWL
jgi:hypothetical protein